MINEFDNDDYERLIKILTMPVIKRIIYNNPLAKVQSITSAAKEFNNMKHKGSGVFPKASRCMYGQGGLRNLQAITNT